jgi:hypothetical protein
MAIYTIQILNESGFTKDYVVFPTPPIVTSTGGPVEVFSNAWVTINNVSEGSFDTLSLTDDIYALWGSAPEGALEPGMTIDASGVQPVDPAQAPLIPFVGETPTGFGPSIDGKAHPWAFAIITSTDFSAANGFVFGMTLRSDSPVPVAAATFLAEPNDRFDIAPTGAFRVANGDCAPGEVIDASLISPDSAIVDFTGLPQTTATVIQGANGGFSVVYS